MAGDWRIQRSTMDDFHSLKAAHLELFPVDYYDDYFQTVCTQSGGIVALSAFDATTRAFAGFVVVTSCAVSELEGSDARLLAKKLQLPREAEFHTNALYILSLGVLPGFQRRGLASALLAALMAEDVGRGASAVFLHVAVFNEAAHAFYASHGFEIVNEQPNFYKLNIDRAPDPTRFPPYYDAYTFALVLPWARLEGSGTSGGTAGADAALGAGAGSGSQYEWRGASREAFCQTILPRPAPVWEAWAGACLSLPSTACSALQGALSFLNLGQTGAHAPAPRSQPLSAPSSPLADFLARTDSTEATSVAATRGAAEAMQHDPTLPLFRRLFRPTVAGAEGW